MSLIIIFNVTQDLSLTNSRMMLHVHTLKSISPIVFGKMSTWIYNLMYSPLPVMSVKKGAHRVGTGHASSSTSFPSLSITLHLSLTSNLN